MTDLDQRLTRLETTVEQALALDGRLAALDKKIADLKPKSSSWRDWLQAFGPYVGGVAAVIVGFLVKDSVMLAMQREQLDLEYVKQMRDLIQDFDSSTNEPAANANAIGLAMYGRHAIAPLVERLKEGDVASLAAQRGLHLAVLNDPAGACPRLTQLLQDSAGRMSWYGAKTLVRVIGSGDCVPSQPVLDQYREAVLAIGTDPMKLAAFATRFADPDTVDFGATSELVTELTRASERLTARRTQLDAGAKPWWRS